MSDLLIPAQVPAFACPDGTKMWVLHLGNLTVDEGWLLRGGGTSTASNLKPESKQRSLVVLAGLIEHPTQGLILFETGCAEDIDVAWGAPVTDIFPRTVYEDKHKLPNAIKATGHDIKDVKAIIFGHLHLDHAGGLEHFLDTGVPVYVHEEEFKHACWAAGTGADLGVYMSHYLDLNRINWRTFTEPHWQFCQGLTLHHTPGHTPGLCSLQVNLKRDGVYLWTTDQYHVKENYHDSQPQGWLARDHTAWVRSHGMIGHLQRLYGATLIFGHDLETYEEVIKGKEFFE